MSNSRKLCLTCDVAFRIDLRRVASRRAANGRHVRGICEIFSGISDTDEKRRGFARGVCREPKVTASGATATHGSVRLKITFQKNKTIKCNITLLLPFSPSLRVSFTPFLFLRFFFTSVSRRAQPFSSLRFSEGQIAGSYGA